MNWFKNYKYTEWQGLELYHFINIMKLRINFSMSSFDVNKVGICEIIDRGEIKNGMV